MLKNQSKKDLNHYLKTWSDDINNIKRPDLKREAFISFKLKFKRDFKPELLEKGTINGDKIVYLKVETKDGPQAVHIGTNKKRVNFYIIP